MHVLNESLHFSVIGVDGIKELEESFNNLHVRFSETFIQIYQVYVVLDLCVVLVHVLQVRQIKQDLLILLLFIVEH